MVETPRERSHVARDRTVRVTSLGRATIERRIRFRQQKRKTTENPPHFRQRTRLDVRVPRLAGDQPRQASRE